MSSQRLIFAFATLATLAVVAQCKDQVLGAHQPGDKLVETRVVQKDAVFEKSVFTLDTFAPEEGKKVTAVELVDRNGDKSGAHAEIIRGGAGQSYVTVRFESKPGFGFNYVVKYYAN